MINLSDIERARETLRKVVRHTPLMTSPTISALCHRDSTAPDEGVYLKAETLQRTGSFKVRGAYNRLSFVPDGDRAKGIVTASAGNHAQGVALAANLLGIPATVFMPETGSIAKIQATKGYGCDVVLEGRTFEEAVIAAHNFQKRKGALFIPAYDDEAVIAGQGTIALEILEDLPDLDCIVIPIGGGGLFAGVSAAIRAVKPKVHIIGVQAAGADNAVRSFHAGRLLPRVEPIDTICDGIAVKSPSPLTFEYIQKFADELVTVDDVSVSSSLLLLVQRIKLVVEPSGAAPLAALLSERAKPRGKTVVLLSGGNIDSKLLSDLIQREMIKENRYQLIFTAVQDKPGSLAHLLDAVASQKANVLSVHHDRLSPNIRLGWTGVEVLVEVRDKDHGSQLVKALRARDYPVEMLEDRRCIEE
ncbi:MAG: threonine ammonia-lyase [Capsulimonadaceae bacterium]|nr:threonine ammonia-lyase [Capsulimonadaceae bacterium]